MAKVDRSVLQANDQNMGDFGDPNKLEASISHLADKIDSNDDDTEVLKTDNTSNKGRLASLEGDVSTLKTDNTSNKSRISTNESNIAYNEGRLTELLRNEQKASEVVDARMGFPVLRDKIESVDTQLADLAVNIRSYWSTTLEAALQAAHDALPSTGGIILIPQNMTVELTNPINITKPNVCIMSINGRYGLTKIQGKTPDMTMFNVDSYGFTLKEIALYGDGEVGNTPTATIIPFKINATASGDADCFLDNVLIANCKNAGEFKGRNIRVKNNCLVSNCHDGFRILGGFSDMRGVEILDVRFHSLGKGNTTGIKTSCIYIDPAANYREVKINVFADDCENVVTGALSSGQIQGSLSYRARGEMFDIDNSLLATPSTERQLKICDNSVSFQLTTNASYGMKFKGLGFQINDNTIQKAAKHGIYLESVSDSEIHDNTINNCGYEANSDGINVDANSARNTIKGNRVKKTDSNSTIRYGIAVEGGDNQFDNNSVYGLTAGNEFYINPSTNKLAYGDTRATLLKQRVTQGTSAPTAGRWYTGDICYNTAPTSEKNITYWICITGGTSGTWRAVGTGQGTTANRPTLTNKDIGYQYFDTDLQKMFYFDGAGYKQISA